MKKTSLLQNTRAWAPAVLGAGASVLFVAVITFAATTINNNISTDGTLTVTGVATFSATTTLSGGFYASSTVFVDGDLVNTRNALLGAATQTPTVTGFNLTGDGYITSGLGVGYATTSDGNLLVDGLTVIRAGRLGVNGTSSPTVEFGVTGNGLFSGGLGVGYATTSGGNLLVDGLTVIRAGRLGVNGTSSPTLEFGVTGSGLLSGGLGVGYATTGSGHLLVSGLAVIQSTGRFGYGSTSPYNEVGFAGDVAVGGALGTSTISIETTSTAAGCIELRASNGTWVRLYPGNTVATTGDASLGNVLGHGGTSLIVGRGRCQEGTD